MTIAPEVATAKQMHEYFGAHVEAGRGGEPAMIDPRGFAYFDAKKHAGHIGLGLPLEGEGDHADGRVFVRAVF